MVTDSSVARGVQFITKNIGVASKGLTNDLATVSLIVAIHESDWMQDAAAIRNQNYHGIKPTSRQPRRPFSPHLRDFAHPKSTFRNSYEAFANLITKSSNFRNFRFQRRAFRENIAIEHAVKFREYVDFLLFHLASEYGPEAQSARTEWRSDTIAINQHNIFPALVQLMPHEWFMLKKMKPHKFIRPVVFTAER